MKVQTEVNLIAVIGIKNKPGVNTPGFTKPKPTAMKQSLLIHIKPSFLDKI